MDRGFESLPRYHLPDTESQTTVGAVDMLKENESFLGLAGRFLVAGLVVLVVASDMSWGRDYLMDALMVVVLGVMFLVSFVSAQFVIILFVLYILFIHKG